MFHILQCQKSKQAIHCCTWCRGAVYSFRINFLHVGISTTVPIGDTRSSRQSAKVGASIASRVFVTRPNLGVSRIRKRTFFYSLSFCTLCAGAASVDLVSIRLSGVFVVAVLAGITRERNIYTRNRYINSHLIFKMIQLTKLWQCKQWEHQNPSESHYNWNCCSGKSWGWGV